jgi:3'-5' exoribonuclease
MGETYLKELSSNDLGDHTIQKQIFIKDLKPKENVHSTFLVRSKTLATAKNAKSYLALILADRTGHLDTRIWEDADEMAASFQEGDIVAVAGKTHSFQDRLQLVVQHLTRLDPGEVDLSLFVPACTEDRAKMFEQLVTVFEGLENLWVREVALKLLRDPDIAARYPQCPAAKAIHHAFIGGLLSHSLQLIRVVDALAPLYPELNRDLLVFGAAFHDFGKIHELSYEGNFGYTDEGRLVGHIAIGVTLLDRKIREIEGFPPALEWQLKHLILSHHGRLEYGSPKRPATLEAQVLAMLDDMDSKIQAIGALIQNDESPARWTSYHKAYDQYYYKPDRTPSETP